MNLVNIIRSFLEEVRVEMKRVTWPNRDQVTGATIAVVIFSLIVAFFVGFLDFVISRLLGLILQ